MKAGWKTVKLGEACKIVNGATPSTSVEANWGGPHCWITPAEMGGLSDPYVGETRRTLTDVGLADCSASLLPAGSVILSSRAPIGHVILNTVPMATNQGCKSMIPRNDLDAKFLFYFIKANVPLLESLGTGATFKELSGGKLASVEIPLPPLAEQKRIVALLDEAFAGIDEAKAKAEANLEDSTKVLESFLDASIQGKTASVKNSGKTAAEFIQEIGEARALAITQGKARLAKSEVNDNSAPFELPSGWKWAQLESLTTCISDGVHKKPSYVTEGIPFVTVKNLTAGPGISFDDLNYITREDHEEYIKRTHPEAGDILITKDGTIGVVRMIETDVEFSIFVSVALIKPVTKKLSLYLTYALSAPCVQKQIIPQGAALKHLYLVDLRRLPIPMPPPSEQERIVTELDLVSEQAHQLRQVYERKARLTDDLRKSILQKAFAGELTA